MAKVLEIGYGAMLGKRKARIVKFVLKHADKIWAGAISAHSHFCGRFRVCT